VNRMNGDESDKSKEINSLRHPDLASESMG
jgi:hypothetical protein